MIQPPNLLLLPIASIQIKLLKCSYGRMNAELSIVQDKHLSGQICVVTSCTRLQLLTQWY